MQNALINYKNFSLILGGEPFISYSKGESKYYYLYSSYTTNYFSKDVTFEFGVDLIAGVEYKLIENIILSGEYGLTLSKENSDVEDTLTKVYFNLAPANIYKANGKSHSLTLNRSGVNLGIAVFF